MAYREYIGSRYVPIFGRKNETTVEWSNNAPYEPLTVVTHQGNSYISRQYVPAGIDIENGKYWVQTGNYNAQIEAYRQEVQGFDSRIRDAETHVDEVEQDVNTRIDNFEQTVNDRVDSLEEDVNGFESQLEKVNAKLYTTPNFRCIDRFIFGEWGTDGLDSAQAGCVFEQDGALYWAQILNSSINGNDRLIIRNVTSNRQVSTLKGQFGHGYTISYNQVTKQLMTQDSESSPYTIIIVNVANITDPFVESTIRQSSVSIDNPCWYDSEHIIGSIGGNRWGVFDLNLNQIDVYTLDAAGYAVRNGYTFQNICWDTEHEEAYIGTTSPDGFMICSVDKDSKTIKMRDYIATQQYYGYLYMRELEFAYRCGDKLYINQFDNIDGLFVVALLEWDMVNGTIPNENSKYIQPTGNIGFAINYETGDLIQDSSKANARYKLAGDAINELNSLAGFSRGYLIFESDYPAIVNAKSAKLSIQTNSESPITIDGFYFANADVIWSPNVVINVKPLQIVPVAGVDTGIGIRCSNTRLRFSLSSNPLPELINTENMESVRRIYSETSDIVSLVSTKTFSNIDHFRWGTIQTTTQASVQDAILQNVIVQTVN